MNILQIFQLAIFAVTVLVEKIDHKHWLFEIRL